jgi:hypothetical protein
MDQQAAWSRQISNNSNAAGFPAALVRCIGGLNDLDVCEQYFCGERAPSQIFIDE